MRSHLDNNLVDGPLADDTPENDISARGKRAWQIFIATVLAEEFFERRNP